MATVKTDYSNANDNLAITESFVNNFQSSLTDLGSDD